ESAFGIPVWVLKILHMASLKMATHMTRVAERNKVVHVVIRTVAVYVVYVQNCFAVRGLSRTAIATAMSISPAHRFGQRRSQGLRSFSTLNRSCDIHASSGTEPGIGMDAVIAIPLEWRTTTLAIENAFRAVTDAPSCSELSSATQVSRLSLPIFGILPKLFRLRSSRHHRLLCLNLASKGILLW